jgi:site-specific DNA-methyltransferase (adenine-specific)
MDKQIVDFSLERELRKPISRVYNMDCMDGLSQTPDKFYELCICDPPYGIGIDGFNTTNSTGTKGSFYPKKGWDTSAPDENYFNELFRVSTNQIIWGANHFISRISIDSSCWIVWDKNRGDQCFADAELAWTSFDTVVKLKKVTWDGFRQDDMKNKEFRIHPTQKPIALYQWLLKNYAKPGNKILDTHLGSQSSRIAAYKMNFPFWGYEIDKQYFDEGCKRFEEAIAEPLFESVKVEQGKLI